MQYRRFGRTNLEIPVLSLGSMRFQKSWDQLDFSEISYKEQNKVENILSLANQHGLSYICLLDLIYSLLYFVLDMKSQKNLVGPKFFEISCYPKIK